MKKILIVEDEKYMLKLLSIHLGKEYRVVEAKDGAQALEYLKGQSYDLIILDIMLPYVDGWTICRKVREKDDTPILMLTARQELSDKVKGFEIGADDYLVKPFEFDELKARVSLIATFRADKQQESTRFTYIDLFKWFISIKFRKPSVICKSTASRVDGERI